MVSSYAPPTSRTVEQPLYNTNQYIKNKQIKKQNKQQIKQNKTKNKTKQNKTKQKTTQKQKQKKANSFNIVRKGRPMNQVHDIHKPVCCLLSHDQVLNRCPIRSISSMYVLSFSSGICVLCRFYFWLSYLGPLVFLLPKTFKLFGLQIFWL